MTRSALLLSVFVAALPLAVEVPGAPDSTGAETNRGETSFTLATGGGTYGLIDRGCEGQPLRTSRIRYVDVGGEVEHRFAGPLTVGVRGGNIHETARSQDTSLPGVAIVGNGRDNPYVNPYVRFDNSWGGIGGGPLFTKEPFLRSDSDPFHPRFSAGLRLGPLDRVSFRLSWMENMPLLSGGGYLVGGVNIALRPEADLFIGTCGAGPEDGGSLLLGGRWWFSPSASVLVRGRVGSSEQVSQNGVAVGLTYRFPGATAARSSRRSP
jgi:hypothetical protein